jgi:hypothetical protein
VDVESDWKPWWGKQDATHDRIMAGQEAAPPCFTCKGHATHYGLTYAGTWAYQCDRHAHNEGINARHRIDYKPLPVFVAKAR